MTEEKKRAVPKRRFLVSVDDESYTICKNTGEVEEYLEQMAEVGDDLNYVDIMLVDVVVEGLSFDKVVTIKVSERTKA